MTAYFTGVRLGELLSIEWRQVDWEQGFITLDSERTKSGHARAVPILEGDMQTWLKWAFANADGCERVFHHDGVPQVVRMRISGHRTDSMERRYNIVDVDDIRAAKELMQRRQEDKK